MKRFELIVGLIAILVIILKIFSIPGGSTFAVLVFSTLSMFCCVCSFATILYFRNKADYSDYYKRIIKRIAIYGGFGLFFLIHQQIFF